MQVGACVATVDASVIGIRDTTRADGARAAASGLTRQGRLGRAPNSIVRAAAELVRRRPSDALMRARARIIVECGHYRTLDYRQPRAPAHGKPRSQAYTTPTQGWCLGVRSSERDARDGGYGDGDGDASGGR